MSRIYSYLSATSMRGLAMQGNLASAHNRAYNVEPGVV